MNPISQGISSSGVAVANITSSEVGCLGCVEEEGRAPSSDGFAIRLFGSAGRDGLQIRPTQNRHTHNPRRRARPTGAEVVQLI
jgi:hypothetical protein